MKKPTVKAVASAIAQAFKLETAYANALDAARAIVAAFADGMDKDERLAAGKALRAVLTNEHKISRVRAWEILKPYGFIQPRNQERSKTAKRKQESEAVTLAAQELVSKLRRQYKTRDKVASILNRAYNINKK